MCYTLTVAGKACRGNTMEDGKDNKTIVGDGKAVAGGKSGVRFNFAKLYKDTAKRLEFSCPATGEFRYVVLHGGIVPVFEKSCIMKLVK